MAGTPIKRSRLENLDAIEEQIFAKLEDGRPLVDIATESACSRPFLMRWLERTPERSQRYKTAREAAADSLADDIQADASNTLKRAISGEASKVEVAAAKLSGDTKRWLAGRWNAKYSDNKANVSVNIDLGQSFLNVLRRGNPQIERDVLPADEVKRNEIPALEYTDFEDVLGPTVSSDPDKQPIKRLANLDTFLEED